jgi:hypothetical protein
MQINSGKYVEKTLMWTNATFELPLLEYIEAATSVIQSTHVLEQDNHH